MSDFMTTYDTPYDRAKALLAELVELAATKVYALPEKQYAQIGPIVRDCPAVIASAITLTPDILYDPVTCVSPRSVTFLVEIIRDCAITFDNDGLTVVEDLENVSEIGALDGQLLYEFAEQVFGWTNKAPWSVQWSFAEAGLQIASLQIAIGVP